MTVPNPPDLTRWNRAGLERFRYVGANAVTMLEAIRAGLGAKFPDWDYVSLKDDIPGNESDAEERKRILDRYRDTRQDWGWEIARAFARAAHILTEHADAFANEGFISTATQWEYLRQLVSMLDYRPLPPSSASTTIALDAKEDVNPGLVATGFQVKHSPQDGGSPVIFETLDDIEIDPRLNALSLRGWNRNPDTFDPFEPLSGKRHWLHDEEAEISVGQPAILIGDTTAKTGGVALAVTIDEIDEAALSIAPAEKIKAVGSFVLKTAAHVLGNTALLIEPEDVRAPALNGANVLRLADNPGLTVGQVIGWKKGSTTGFARIVAADRFGLEVTDVRPAGEDITGGGVELFRALRHDGQVIKGEKKFRFALGSTNDLTLVGANADGSLAASIMANPEFKLIPVVKDGEPTHEELTFTGNAVYFLDTVKAEKLATAKAPPADNVFDFDGGPGEFASGDRLVAESRTGALAPVRVKSVQEREDSFILMLADIPETLGGIARLHGPFATRLLPDGHDRNPRPVNPGALELELLTIALPAGLTVGKTVLVDKRDAGSGGESFATKITGIVNAGGRFKALGGHPRLVLDAPAEKFAGFDIGGLVVRANAVLAGHGESKPEFALGSGDAARTGQSFTIEKEYISFVADPALEAGVRAAIEVRIDSRLFEEVSTLADSEVYDAHYTTEMTEEGHVRIRFGDGVHGRRLPTGRSNLRATYRAGTGAEGNNLPPASLEKPVKPHPLVEAVHQPVATAGGQDMEDLAGIRANAPSYLRTLGRGVSLADFAHLARTQPGIWHANAFHVPGTTECREIVELALVPADGSPLGDLGSQLRERLTGLAPPSILFRITRFDAAPLDLRLRLRVDTHEFDPDAVVDDVRAAVYGAFSLEKRAPGQPLYLSDIYQVAEAVTGVANSEAVLFEGQNDPITSESGATLRASRNDGGQIWAIWPSGRQDVFITRPSAIVITQEELSL